jgi:hypothetical protein
LSGDNISRPLLSKPQFHSTLYPEGCASAKVTVSLGELKVFFLCPTLSRSCQNTFPYICSEVVLKSQRKPLSQAVKKAYELYFGRKLEDQDKIWAPKSCCSSCSRALAGCLEGTHKSMPFAVQMAWHEPKDCLRDLFLHDQDRWFLPIFHS